MFHLTSVKRWKPLSHESGRDLVLSLGRLALRCCAGISGYPVVVLGILSETSPCGHRVGDNFSAIGLIAQLGRKKINKAWTSEEDERLRKLIISNVPAFDIAADLGRTVTAVIARAQSLGIPRGCLSKLANQSN